MAGPSIGTIGSTLSTLREIPCRGGCRPHRCKTKSLPANPDKPGRPKPGKGVQWLRRTLCGIAKHPKGGGRKPWVEVDLNRCFNAKGYSLSWGRELFRRLQRDAFWNNLCKVRYVQKRLETNGCFVILIAFRSYLKWDEEPLFYERDRKTTRHLRTALRAEDLELVNNPPEIVNNSNAVQEERRHCPVPLYNEFPTYGTADEINNGRAVENTSSRFAEETGRDLVSDEPSSIEKPLPQPNGISKVNGNCRSACAPQQRSGVIQCNGRRTGNVSAPQRLACRENFCATRVGPALRGFILWLVLDLKADMVWTWRGTDARSATVPFVFANVFAFVRRAAVAGYEAKVIRNAWDDAVHATHADVVDGLCRHPIALCSANAERILSRSDPRTREQRLAEFYSTRKKLFTVQSVTKTVKCVEKHLTVIE